MYIGEAQEADISGEIPINFAKSKDLDKIDGKTPLILRKK